MAAGIRQKYAEAVALYASACLSLRRVAEMCGMSPCGFDRGDSRIYNKVWSPTVRPLTGYVGRNCPAERESHRRMVGNSMKTGKIAM